MKVFFLISDLAFHGPGKQLSLLAAALPRERFEVRVGVLGRDGPWGDHLRAAGVGVDVLRWTRLIDPRPIWRLRQLVQGFQPDVLHGWGASALWAGLLMGDQPRLVIHTGLLPRDPAAHLNQLERWLLQRADRLVAWSQAEEQAYQELGVPREKICRIPPAVALEERSPGDPRAFRAAHRLPENARLLIGVGPLEPHKGFREAVWAFDILKYLYDDLHLVLIGEGSDRDRLEGFTGAIQARDRVHFVGRQADVADWLAQAEAVWVPRRGAGGVNVVLEAMAAGVPVVASRVPGMAEVVTDEETGYLVPPGDKVALARQTRLLLEDSPRRQQFGAAGRKRAAEHFAVADLVSRHAALYQSPHA
jgi:glycosyltransferase involved in cell wall biosynthesis